MPLSYKELLSNIENILEQKFNDRFEKLSADLIEVKSTNSHLIELNKALIVQNKQLRASVSSVDTDRSTNDTDAAVDVNVDADASVSTVNSPHASTKSFSDILILSDSIFRHVGSECPKENDRKANIPVISNFTVGTVTFVKAVCPGARCVDLLCAAAQLSTSHSFDQVIVNVGANYTRDSRNGRGALSPDDTALEIQDFLVAIGDLFEAKVSFSCILPQPSVINGINHVNTRVCAFCEEYGLGFTQCLRFKRRHYQLDFSLFAKDGVHLSRKGVECLFNSMIQYVTYELELA